ncbi:MAG: hypothetical protein U0835_26190 [Isosphaeraceae bacterium]
MAQIRAATERLRDLAPRIPAVLSGADTSKDASERLDLTPSAGSATPAATTPPREDVRGGWRPTRRGPKTWPRPTATRPPRGAVKRAGCGLGREQPAPGDSDLARWRSRALDWLRADLTLRSLQSRSNVPAARTEALRSLLIWKGDPSLAGVREPEKLARIPESERQGWEKFWSEVDALVAPPKAG